MTMQFSHLKKHTFLGIVLSLFILQGLYVYAFFVEPNILSVERIKIYSSSLHRTLGGLKIIHISDIHLADLSYLTVKLIQTIRKIEPDIIFISGDIIGTRSAIGNFYNFFSLLRPTKATYIVFGDSDNSIRDIFNPERLRAHSTYYIQGKVLNLNFKEDKSSFFWLVGCYGSEDGFIQNLDLPKNGPKILLTHRPDIIKSAALKGFDLVLAGHTHGSQTGISILRRVFGYAYRSPYISGLYKVRNTFLFVNRGIYSEKHVRLFSPPQLAILEFLPGSKENYRILPQDR